MYAADDAPILLCCQQHSYQTCARGCELCLFKGLDFFCVWNCVEKVFRELYNLNFSFIGVSTYPFAMGNMVALVLIFE